MRLLIGGHAYYWLRYAAIDYEHTCWMAINSFLDAIERRQDYAAPRSMRDFAQKLATTPANKLFIAAAFMGDVYFHAAYIAYAGHDE